MNMKSFRMLIIEPDVEVGELLKSNIQLEYGCTVDLATTLLEAQALAQRHSYDLISTEQHLPATSGPIKGNQFISELRASDNENSHTPILFFTVYSEEVFKGQLTEKEDIYVLDKTSTMDKYLSWVKILLYSQYKRKKNRPLKVTPEKSVTPEKEEQARVINFVREL